MGDFIELIKEGFRLATNVGMLPLDAVKAAVVGYFRQVKKWSIRLFIVAIFPLIVIVPCMMFHLPLGWLYGTYVVYFALLVAAELLLITPMFLVWRRVKAAFSTLASDMEDWAGFIKNVVFNGLSLGIFVTLVPIWKSPGSLPLLLLVVACWLTLPACSLSNVCKRIYPAVRAVQLLLLLALLVLQTLFPRQMEQLTWLTTRRIGSTLILSVNQQEITAHWKDLQWFNNAGEPLVWYSGFEGEGFKLWTAPGFDPLTGKELPPVKDEKRRIQITTSLTERQRTFNERSASEQSEVARKEAERRRQQQEESHKLAVEQAAKDKADFLVRYIDGDTIPKSNKGRSFAIVVSTESGQINNSLGVEIANSLDEAAATPILSLFKPAFIADGLFAESFAGSPASLNNLEISNRVDMLILARQSGTYSTNATLENIITATINLELAAFPSAKRHQSVIRTIAASGVGFKPDDARNPAEDRITKQINMHVGALVRAVLSSTR